MEKPRNSKKNYRVTIRSKKILISVLSSRLPGFQEKRPIMKEIPNSLGIYPKKKKTESDSLGAILLGNFFLKGASAHSEENNISGHKIFSSVERFREKILVYKFT